MNARAAILGCFVMSVAIITFRDSIHPDSEWPLPAPPPYRYVSAGVAFGLLAFVADTFSDKLAAVLAFGLVLGLGIQVSQAASVGGSIGSGLGGLLGGGVGKAYRDANGKAS